MSSGSDGTMSGIPIEFFWSEKELDVGPPGTGELIRWGQSSMLVRWGGELTIIPRERIAWVTLKGEIPPGFSIDL